MIVAVFTRKVLLTLIGIKEAGASKGRVPKVDLGNQRKRFTAEAQRTLRMAFV